MQLGGAPTGGAVHAQRAAWTLLDCGVLTHTVGLRHRRSSTGRTRAHLRVSCAWLRPSLWQVRHGSSLVRGVNALVTYALLRTSRIHGCTHETHCSVMLSSIATPGDSLSEAIERPGAGSRAVLGTSAGDFHSFLAHRHACRRSRPVQADCKHCTVNSFGITNRVRSRIADRCSWRASSACSWPERQDKPLHLLVALQPVSVAL